jgi:RNA recognition motif-containing protein
VADTFHEARTAERITMTNKLYVGNLSGSTGDDDLRRTFAPFGTLVSVSVVIDHITGQPRGFGFVEYERSEDALNAIQSVNGRQVNGRKLTVSIAPAREPKVRFGVGSGDLGEVQRRNRAG